MSRTSTVDATLWGTVALLSVMPLAGCTGSPASSASCDPGDYPPDAQPVAYGHVLDSRGRPVIVRIVAYLNGTATTYGTAKENGCYSLKILQGVSSEISVFSANHKTQSKQTPVAENGRQYEVSFEL
jgi:hypothetical protein